MNKFLLIILTATIIFSTFVKLQAVNNYNFPFTMDQGRDMVDIRQMVVSKSPRLVGPTTSINGVLLGPFWYYFLLPPFLLSGGNPQAIVYWQIFWYQISALVLWHVLKKRKYLFASIVAILYLLMPMGFNTGRYFWNANAMPIFTGFFFACLLWAMDKLSAKRLLVLGLLAGISMQIEAAFGILFFPFVFLYLVLQKRSIKELFWLTTGFFATLLPQIAFELRHNFIMTKVLIAEFTGKGEMLGEKMDFLERIAQRYATALGLINFSSHLPSVWVRLLFVFGLAILVVTLFLKTAPKKLSVFYSTVLGFILFSSSFYILFPQTLKSWYTLGMCVAYVSVLGIAIYTLVKSKSKVLQALGVFLLVSTCYFSSKSQLDYLNHVAFLPSIDRSNLRNEIADINWVYQNAKGEGFNAYSYLPSVYDFPYHYLYSWYGTKQYGYQPADVAYLPGMPEYIKDNDLIWTKKKALGDNKLTFLIIEKDHDHPEREAAWLGNFSKFCTLKETNFSWTARGKMLTSICHK
jgi:hypothetical protein